MYDLMLCLVCGNELKNRHLWCFNDLGGPFEVHEPRPCWPRDRTVYDVRDHEHLRVAVREREPGVYYVYEVQTPCPLPDRLMANGKTFEREWVEVEAPFGGIHQLDVFGSDGFSDCGHIRIAGELAKAMDRVDDHLSVGDKVEIHEKRFSRKAVEEVNELAADRVA